MGKGSLDGYKVCDECGAFYLNFCLNCAKRGLDERVWEIMNRHELNEEELVRILAAHIADGSFPALNLAITLRDMKPANRSEISVADSKELSGAKERLGNLLSRLATGNRKRESSE